MRKTTGISLLLLIFLSLCLVTFSLMSYSGANADYKLSEKAALRTTTYQQAENEARLQVKEIERQLAAYLVDTENKEKTSLADKKEFYQQKLPELVNHIKQQYDPYWDGETNELGFTVPIEGEQILVIALEIAYPEKDEDTFYQIHRWKTVNQANWNPDRKLHVLQIP